MSIREKTKVFKEKGSNREVLSDRLISSCRKVNERWVKEEYK